MFPHGTFENGFRHISSNRGPIRTPADLAGLPIRVPDGEIFRDLFRTLGAQPATINIRDLYAALRDGPVVAQENPLVITEVNRLYEVQRTMSLTGHMWSGFNLIGNLAFWQRLPEDARTVVLRRARAAVDAQRAYTDGVNRALEAGLAARGMVFNRVDMAPFRAALPAFYARWKAHFGARVWAALEAETGRLG
jgi:TRAP-type C4-dicarboxylate transport system substrate-binding protein